MAKTAEKTIRLDIDSRSLEGDDGATLGQLMRAQYPEGFERGVAAKLNGRVVDFHTPIHESGRVDLLSLDSPEGLQVLRHSTAHLMASAVVKLFPEAKLAIGPAIEEGFYYDFQVDRPFQPEDLEKIEKLMHEIAEENHPFVRGEMKRTDAIREFREKHDTFKLELAEGIPDDTVSTYTHSFFTDLCRGPHVPRTRVLKSFKLLSVAGAYWRGDSNRPMLQRIYGTAFASKDRLKEHLARIEEAKKRDHRKLGHDLDLFSVHEEAGGGLIFWHPHGAAMRRVIEDFWKDEHLRRGYQLVNTPHIAQVDLWEQSGHTGFYRQNMYFMNVDEKEYVLKPMNCPFHILIFKRRKSSYRDLPIRIAELGTVYRLEKSGVLHGLARVRGFTQDDAHLFCTGEQVETELVQVLDFTRYMLDTFGFTHYQVDLSVRDASRKQDYMGSDEDWALAEGALERVVKSAGLSYHVAVGEAVFYGPKIDIKLTDAIGRSWQCSTIQFDFNLPRRFDVKYVGSDGQEHQVYMIHRALLGSMERFFATLIEHYGGDFPVWLAPVQVRLITIAGAQASYAEEIRQLLLDRGIRVEADLREEKINAKIRDAELLKIPYMLVLGKREVEERTVSVRTHHKQSQDVMKLREFVEKVVAESKVRS
ncbi:MAG: threonine--tRNA ligase [Candidatus Eisenbacteria bacterium]|uniref:Threonine--tRNA ligase n=1 Tax=Eiseniibacteriota bacterium TaxID=2212470 RepID=A0A538SBY4_UNCEI|nr:MAG: threonine--tRNA ligase [Candidatus Eisenbacteria bacterium]